MQKIGDKYTCRDKYCICKYIYIKFDLKFLFLEISKQFHMPHFLGLYFLDTKLQNWLRILIEILKIFNFKILKEKNFVCHFFAIFFLSFFNSWKSVINMYKYVYINIYIYIILSY